MIDLEALKKKWSAEIEQAKREGAALADARRELRAIAVALYFELDEATKASDAARALPIMAALADANRVIEAMNASGIESVLRGYELVLGIKVDPVRN
jgi:histidine ammonia-lyase